MKRTFVESSGTEHVKWWKEFLLSSSHLDSHLDALREGLVQYPSAPDLVELFVEEAYRMRNVAIDSESNQQGAMSDASVSTQDPAVSTEESIKANEQALSLFAMASRVVERAHLRVSDIERFVAKRWQYEAVNALGDHIIRHQWIIRCAVRGVSLVDALGCVRAENNTSNSSNSNSSVTDRAMVYKERMSSLHKMEQWLESNKIKCGSDAHALLWAEVLLDWYEGLLISHMCVQRVKAHIRENKIETWINGVQCEDSQKPLLVQRFTQIRDKITSSTMDAIQNAQQQHQQDPQAFALFIQTLWNDAVQNGVLTPAYIQHMWTTIIDGNNNTNKNETNTYTEDMLLSICVCVWTKYFLYSAPHPSSVGIDANGCFSVLKTTSALSVCERFVHMYNIYGGGEMAKRVCLHVLRTTPTHEDNIKQMLRSHKQIDWIDELALNEEMDDSTAQVTLPLHTLVQRQATPRGMFDTLKASSEKSGSARDQCLVQVLHRCMVHMVEGHGGDWHSVVQELRDSSLQSASRIVKLLYALLDAHLSAHAEEPSFVLESHMKCGDWDLVLKPSVGVTMTRARVMLACVHVDTHGWCAPHFNVKSADVSDVRASMAFATHMSALFMSLCAMMRCLVLPNAMVSTCKEIDDFCEHLCTDAQRYSNRGLCTILAHLHNVSVLAQVVGVLVWVETHTRPYTHDDMLDDERKSLMSIVLPQQEKEHHFDADGDDMMDGEQEKRVVDLLLLHSVFQNMDERCLGCIGSSTRLGHSYTALTTSLTCCCTRLLEKSNTMAHLSVCGDVDFINESYRDCARRYLYALNPHTPFPKDARVYVNTVLGQDRLRQMVAALCGMDAILAAVVLAQFMRPRTYAMQIALNLAKCIVPTRHFDELYIPFIVEPVLVEALVHVCRCHGQQHLVELLMRQMQGMRVEIGGSDGEVAAHILRLMLLRLMTDLS